jgi:hypothetical protein
MVVHRSAWDGFVCGFGVATSGGENLGAGKVRLSSAKE